MQYGVPWEFNAILDDLLDGGNTMMNEEEYKMQMNLSMSAIPNEPGETPHASANVEVNERIMTEIDEQQAEHSTPRGSYERSDGMSQKSGKRSNGQS